VDEYITRSEFEQFKRQVEQKTEEMKAIRVDVHNVDVETIKQELHTLSDTWLETLQEHYDEHTARFDKIETVQSGHSKYFEEHGKRLTKIETDVSSIKSTQEQILKLLQQNSLPSDKGDK
jgi:chromosome segregation ATPase